MRTEPNENLKRYMKRSRKAAFMYREMADEDIRIFLNEWANLYATNPQAATALMVSIDRDRQRRNMPHIQA